MKTTTNLTVSHLSPLISYVPGMLWSDGGEDPLKARAWFICVHTLANTIL